MLQTDMAVIKKLLYEKCILGRSYSLNVFYYIKYILILSYCVGNAYISNTGSRNPIKVSSIAEHSQVCSSASGFVLTLLAAVLPVSAEGM